MGGGSGANEMLIVITHISSPIGNLICKKAEKNLLAYKW